MTKGKRTLSLAVVVLILAVGNHAWANDKVTSTVSIPTGQPVPIVSNNGVPSGTIQLFYSITGTTFPCGQLAQFNLNLLDSAGTGQSTTYPVELDLVQSGGGTPVQFSPNPSTLSAANVGWQGTSLVTVYIDCSKLSGSPTDGQDIVGNLNEQTNSQGAHLDTISTIQVHIKLVFPTTCLKLYSFETDQDTGSLLSSVTVVANHSGSVKSTNPGQASVDALVANTCAQSESFDILVSLDPEWQTNPHNNPANATYTYFTTGEVDPTTFSLSAFGTGTAQGEMLCLTNVTLPGGESFLTTVHSQLNTDYNGGLTTSLLPGDKDFDFGAALYTANSGCSGTPLPSSIVGPSNPAASTLGFTLSN